MQGVLQTDYMSIFISPSPSDCMIQMICVAKGTGLGLVIKGGANRAEGPMVFIQEIVPGGDCQRVNLHDWHLLIHELRSL